MARRSGCACQPNLRACLHLATLLCRRECVPGCPCARVAVRGPARHLPGPGPLWRRGDGGRHLAGRAHGGCGAAQPARCRAGGRVPSLGSAAAPRPRAVAGGQVCAREHRQGGLELAGRPHAHAGARCGGSAAPRGGLAPLRAPCDRRGRAGCRAAGCRPFRRRAAGRGAPHRDRPAGRGAAGCRRPVPSRRAPRRGARCARGCPSRCTAPDHD